MKGNGLAGLSNTGAATTESPPVVVLAECDKGEVEKVTFELLGDARKIAPIMKAQVELVLLTSAAHSDAALRQLRLYVRERVHLVEHPLLEDYITETFLQAVEVPLKRLQPRILMVGATANGRDLGPRLAARFGVGYAPHCLTLKAVAQGKMELTRVSHGGRVHVQSIWPSERPIIITMKPGVADAPAPLSAAGGLVIERHEVNIERDRVRVVERIPADPKTQDIREAERIVSGGRGVGGPEGFAVVQDLAEALNAAGAASRVAVDLGWMEHARQVGQTGKTVAPKLYVAVGISGASHHMMGMRGAEKIVAVNMDKQAPIFSISHFGVIGDLHQVLPRLARRIRQHKAQMETPAQAARMKA